MWKTEYFGLKLSQDLGNRAAHPYQEFRGVPPGFHPLEWNYRIAIYSKSVHNENGVFKIKICSGIDVNLPGFLKTALLNMY